MSSTTTNICCIAGCDNILAPHARLRACATCRQSLCAWEKRPVGHILRRATNLKKYTARMDLIARIEGDFVSRVGHGEIAKQQILDPAKPKKRSRK